MKSLLVTLVFTAAATVASAQLANPDFETGDFTGWTNTSADGGAYVFSGAEENLTFLMPFEGAFYLALIGNSSIVQTTGIHLRPRETVSVWMNASQGGGGSLNLIPNSGPAIHVPWRPVYRPGEIFPVRWNQISFEIQQDGIYSIGVSRADSGEGGPSFLGVDLFTITPVPEPSSYGLLAAVLGVAAIMWRQRKAATAT